ncbi:MAG: hypothetical protein CL760_08790 [Chloroflexi bacterium]|nr:hypothetical protein [Chloroflexota bacterium]
MSISYRDMKNLFEKEIRSLKNLLSNLRGEESKYESELRSLKDVKKNQLDKLHHVVLRSIGNNDDMLGYVRAIKSNLNIPFEVGFSLNERLVNEMNQSKEVYEKARTQVVISHQKLDELEKDKSEKSDLYYSNREKFNIFQNLNSDVNDIKQFAKEKGIDISECEKVGFFSRLFMTSRSALSRDIHSLIASIEKLDLEEVSTRNGFAQFDRMAEEIVDGNIHYQAFRQDFDNAVEAVDKYTEDVVFKVQNKRTTAKYDYEDKRNKLDKRLFFKLFDLLTEEQQEQLFKAYLISPFANAQKDAESRIKFLNKVISGIEADKKQIKETINSLDKNMFKLNRAARKAPNKRNNKFNRPQFDKNMNNLKLHYSKKQRWYEDTHSKYRNNYNDTMFDSVDALMLILVINSISDNAEVGHALFANELSDFSIDDLDLESLNINSFEIDNLSDGLDLSDLAEIALDFDIPDIPEVRVDIPDIGGGSSDFGGGGCCD